MSERACLRALRGVHFSVYIWCRGSVGAIRDLERPRLGEDPARSILCEVNHECHLHRHGNYGRVWVASRKLSGVCQANDCPGQCSNTCCNQCADVDKTKFQPLITQKQKATKTWEKLSTQVI